MLNRRFGLLEPLPSGVHLEARVRAVGLCVQAFDHNDDNDNNDDNDDGNDDNNDEKRTTTNRVSNQRSQKVRERSAVEGESLDRYKLIANN